MKAYENPLYLEDVAGLSALPLEWSRLAGKTIAVSGATGMIGSCLVDLIMKKNAEGLGCRIIAFGRNATRAAERFRKYSASEDFIFACQDINEPVVCNEKADFVIHMASNTHPVAYATEPVSTIMTNISGLRNMLEYARGCGEGCRFAFASSNEVYGQNRGDAELFDESYCGYIDCNTLRAGYPESKRCGEALCQAYARQYGMDVVIPRFTRSFGPTLLPTDTKALSQFIRNAIAGEDIVLKSEGRQYFSYSYVADAVSGLLYILLYGKSGEAYNIADLSCDITLRDLATEIAGICGTSVVLDLPDAVEAAGFSKATKARLDSTKLRELGWKARYSLKTALERTIITLREADVK